MTKTARERWYADETNVPYLSKVLADPKVMEALTVLEEEGAATPIMEAGNSADVLTKHALKHKELIGYNKFLRKLRELAEKEPTPLEGTPDQYSEEYMKKWAAERGYVLPAPQSGTEE
jgi:hypothetical protein